MTTHDPATATMVPLAKIRRGANPRRHFDQVAHTELVASLKLRGMLQPILLRPISDTDDMFELVAGERRLRAAQEAFGEDGAVPATIRDMTDQEAIEAAIDENDIREDASETEQADAALRVLAACENDRAEAARRLGWSTTKLDRRIALSGLHDAVKTALDERRIKVGHAELLAAVPADKQETALNSILDAGLDVARTRTALMRLTQDLAAATFDTAECATCPFNAATQRALFGTHVDEGHCTNAGCYQLKTDAAEKAKAPAEPETVTDSGAASAGQTPAGDSGPTTARSTPDSAPAPSPGQERASPAQAVPLSPSPAPARAPKVTAISVAARASAIREMKWRAAVADTVAGDDTHTSNTILLAAMSGTLTQIDADKLAARATIAIDEAFPELSFADQIAAIWKLTDNQFADTLQEIAAAWVKDVRDFAHVAELARALKIDLRDSWKVDGEFLDRFNKDELRFIALECGLVAHVGEKIFANMLKGKPHELIAGMLHAAGFEWGGRLPGAMTLDGTYGAPPEPAPTEEPAPSTVEKD